MPLQDHPSTEAIAARPAGCIDLQGLPARRPSHCGWQPDGWRDQPKLLGHRPREGDLPGGHSLPAHSVSPLHAASGLLCTNMKMQGPTMWPAISAAGSMPEEMA